MAGIFVHYDKVGLGSSSSFHSLNDILSVMKAEPDQTHKELHQGQVRFGVVAKISQDVNELWYHDSELGISIVLDGFCRIAKDFINQLGFRPDSTSQRDHLKGICQLAARDVENWIDMLEGSFNIAVYDLNRDRLTIANDIFGFYPLYWTETSHSFVFSSKIVSLLESGVLDRPSFDYVSFAEHLLLNYTISDNSYVKDVKLLPAATFVEATKTRLSRLKYYLISDRFTDKALNSRDSFELLDSSLKDACQKFMSYSRGEVNMSLTGGWDSRLVLSYLIKDHKDRLRLYSFGAEEAPDITVPQHICSSEGLDYTPIILDDKYLREVFEKAAHDTIMFSEGTRNYKRTHYLYAIEKIASRSCNLMTGIFGDELLKVGKPKGGSVISNNVVRLLENRFVPDKILKDEIVIVSRVLSGQYNLDATLLKEQILNRLDIFSQSHVAQRESSYRYLVFRFDSNLRRYFGTEAASYNDYVNCYSPFIDKQLLKNYMKTSFAFYRFPFTPSSMLAKQRTTRLYARLVGKNYSHLLDYTSNRGYSMKQALSFVGNIEIILHKYPTKTHLDPFATKNVRSIFENMLHKLGAEALKPDSLFGKVDDLNTLIYWAKNVGDFYSI